MISGIQVLSSSLGIPFVIRLGLDLSSSPLPPNGVRAVGWLLLPGG